MQNDIIDHAIADHDRAAERAALGYKVEAGRLSYLSAEGAWVECCTLIQVGGTLANDVDGRLVPLHVAAASFRRHAEQVAEADARAAERRAERIAAHAGPGHRIAIDRGAADPLAAYTVGWVPRVDVEHTPVEMGPEDVAYYLDDDTSWARCAPGTHDYATAHSVRAIEVPKRVRVAMGWDPSRVY